MVRSFLLCCYQAAIAPLCALSLRGVKSPVKFRTLKCATQEQSNSSIAAKYIKNIFFNPTFVPYQSCRYASFFAIAEIQRTGNA
jgi:hypothetical protein